MRWPGNPCYNISCDSGSHEPGTLCPKDPAAKKAINKTAKEAAPSVASSKNTNSYDRLGRYMDYMKEPSKSQLASLDSALLRAVDGGLNVASDSYPTHKDAQISVLAEPLAVHHFMKLYLKYPVRSKQLNLALRNIQAGKETSLTRGLYPLAHTVVAKGGNPDDVLTTDKAYGALNASERTMLLHIIDQGVDDSRLLQTSGRLFAHPRSPYSERARKLLQDELESAPTTGYTPSDQKVHVSVPTSDLARKMDIPLDELPYNAVAFDIETDTSQGYGLRPKKGMITDIVLSTRDESIVLSGDERFILTEFAKKMNSLPSGTKVIGWNSYNFDNIFVDIRARHHNIEGWEGELVDDPHDFGRPPVEGFEHGQKLVWGDLISEDVLREQMRAEYDEQNNPTPRAKALKPFVKSYGAAPIEVDRANMHELDDKTRIDYILSDGVATLFAHKKVQDQTWK